MRNKNNYSELENKTIESVKEQLKKELNEMTFPSSEVSVTIGKDKDGDLCIQAEWNHFDYSDNDRYGGFSEDKFIVSRHYFSKEEMVIPGLLEETIKDFIGQVEKIPEDTIEARTYLKTESRIRNSRVFDTIGTNPEIYKLKENETVCKNGKYFDEEEKGNNKNELNSEHITPAYEKYRNKRDDDDGGDDGGEGPAAELTPSYDDEGGMEL